MNITVNKSRFVFLLFCFIVIGFISSCKEKNEEHKKIFLSFSNEWKTDTTGCLGLREKIISDSLNILKKFIGYNNNEFLENFGNPNATKKGDNVIQNSYWISCSKVPEVKGIKNVEQTNKKINTEANQLIVEVDSCNIIKSIRVIIP